jgi:hypothetical protein
MEKCRICQKEFQNLKSLATHINNKHNMSSKIYYDNFILIENGDRCYVCGNKTTFRGLGVGYLENCSAQCRDKNKTINRGYWNGKKQSKEMIKKRIKNTNQQIKETQRKKTMLEKYGEDNPAKVDLFATKISQKNKGKKVIRDENWQRKIINSKKNNGTINHTKKTKNKISESLNKYHQTNKEKSKYCTINNNKNNFCGWYGHLYFRSSLELSFLVHNNDKELQSCETDKFKIPYFVNDKEKGYFPDFTDNNFIYEIKPTSLLEYGDNQIKINRGIEIYGDKFKVITEQDYPYLTKSKILELIDTGAIKVNVNSIKRLKNYKH